jgi:type II secretory ATPase GspE/PulE/Tfp pilus assembly ATPase PilB-like protein
VNYALHVQKRQIQPQRLGDILIEKGYVTQQKLRKIVEASGQRRRFGELLVRQGHLTDEQLDQALAEQLKSGHRLVDILLATNGLDEEDLAKALARQMDLPYVVPQPARVDVQVAKRLSESFMLQNLAVAINNSGGVVTVLVADPTDANLRRRLEERLQCEIEVAVATKTKIENLIDGLRLRTSAGAASIPEDSANSAASESSHLLRLQSRDMESRGAGSDKNMLDYVIWDAWNRHASDIHIESRREHLQVRYRIDGTLICQTELPSALAQSIFRRAEALASLDTEAPAQWREGLIQANIDGQYVDLRLAIAPSVLGKSMVVRLCSHGMDLAHLADLGMPPKILATFLGTVEKNAGLVLFIGPKEVGRLSSLCLIKRLNDGTRKIVTVECPVTFVLDGVLQNSMETSQRAAVPSILASLVQHDPDVMVLDEIPDLQTAEAILKCVMRGHQFVTTMHTDDAVTALLQLAHVDTLSFFLRGCPLVIVSQRFVRLVCSFCAESYTPPVEVLREFQTVEIDTPAVRFRRGVGCPQCMGSGFAGRTAISELLVVNPEIREAISRNCSMNEVKQIVRRDPSFLALWQTGFIRACQGITTLEEIQRVVPSKEAGGPDEPHEALSELLQRAGERLDAH